MKRGEILLLILAGIFVISFIYFVNAADDYTATMIVEANIDSDAGVVKIEVPEKVSFGDIAKGEVSDKIKVYINNTGTVNVFVTPKLKDPNEKIFSNLYFQTRQQSKTPELNEVYRIGDYRLNISSSREYFYMWLDLEDYSGSINQDMINHTAEIEFIAMAQ